MDQNYWHPKKFKTVYLWNFFFVRLKKKKHNYTRLYKKKKKFPLKQWENIYRYSNKKMQCSEIIGTL